MTAIVDAAENTKSYLKPNSGRLDFERAGRFARLGERLVNEGLVSEQNLQLALQEQTRRGVRLGEALLELGLVDEGRLLPLLAEQLGVESVRIRDGLVDPETVRLISRSAATDLNALVLFRVDDEITLAMADPGDLDAIDRVARMTGHRVRPVLALRSNLEKMISRCYEDDFSVDEMTADVDVDAMELDSEAIEIDFRGIESLADGSPVINLVNYAIIQAVRQGASDIHIEPGQKHTSVRFRVDGLLREIMRPKREIHPAIVSRVKVMAKLDIAEHRLPQDGRIHVRLENREIDLRVSTLPTVLGQKVVLRVLDRANITFDLNRLGIPDQSLSTMRGMLSRTNGLVLVTGPTGSGKTTTLYSAIELIKGVHSNVVTVEDPVEYQLGLINQVPVGRDSGMTFANALRSILRQDPDVILVGEIRDAETAEVAIQAALTGHLVLSTLHTSDAAGAITRLHDMGVAPYKLASALLGVVAQRLVRSLCPHCQTIHYPPESLLRELKYGGDMRRGFIRGAGCSKCFDTGHHGRTGIYEVMRVSPEIRLAMLQHDSAEAIRKLHLAQGGTTLLREGLRLAEEGVTSLEEVGRVAMIE
jgi:type IV pilus assembly protein PilB